MTDNLSNNLNRRIFRSETAPSLGENYRRPPEIENQITEALLFSETEFATRLAVADFKSEKYLKGETLVCLLSAAHSENLFQIKDIAESLARICERLVRRFLRVKDLGENFIEEAVGEIIAEMFAQILGRGKQSYDFWEVNFYVSVQRLATNFCRKHRSKSNLTDTFSELSNAGNEDEFSFEARLEKFETLTIEKKLEVKEILGKMTDENRQIFIFHRVEGWTQEQIAEVFGVTARTVRNRLKFIDNFLSDFRSAQGGEI